METVVTLKLGKRPPRPRVKAIHFADYLTQSAQSILDTIQVPDETNFDPASTALRMWANDRYGDCAFAGQANAELVWAAARGETLALTDDNVLEAYSACTGFDPSKPETDQGTVLVAALDQWQRDGIGGRKIVGRVSIDWRNTAHVRLAGYLFGVVYFGAALPLTAQADGLWDGPSGDLAGDAAPGSWGGHCLTTARQATASGDALTWQRAQSWTRRWWLDYVDECYGPLSTDWADVSRIAPNGFALAQLQRDLAAMGTP